MPEEHTPPQSPDDWILVAERALRNLKGSYKGGISNDAKIEFALAAVEAILKAIIWRKYGWNKWPDRNSSYKWLYYHNCERLLNESDESITLKKNKKLWASWLTIVNVSKRQSRYSPIEVSDAEANQVAKSVRHPDVGIVPCLMKRYRKMI